VRFTAQESTTDEPDYRAIRPDLTKHGRIALRMLGQVARHRDRCARTGKSTFIDGFEAYNWTTAPELTNRQKFEQGQPPNSAGASPFAHGGQKTSR
jgi:hypothetical protein